MKNNARTTRPASTGLYVLLLAVASCGGGAPSAAENLLDNVPDVPELPGLEEDSPYADLHPSLGSVAGFPLRGRIVYEETADRARGSLATTPLSQFSQDEIPNAPLELALVPAASAPPLATQTAQSDEEGYLDGPIDLQTGASDSSGQYTVEVRHNGNLIGTTSVRLLAENSSDLVVRSDVDMTYLNTDFTSHTALLELLQQAPGDRTTLPGMAAIYSGLRVGVAGTSDRPLTFLSGSPKFFKRVLEGKMLLDGVLHDGLVLKPYKDIVVTNLLALDLDDIMPELKEQIGYKLTWLLRLRQEIPPHIPEILLGDDTEADVVAYTLYHRLTAGVLSPEELNAQLQELGVSSGWQSQVSDRAAAVAALYVDHDAPVRAIYINRTGWDTAHYAVADWAVDGITRYHTGAWPLALDLYESGWISAASAQLVRAELLALGQSEATLHEAAEAGVSDGFLAADTASSLE